MIYFNEFNEIDFEYVTKALVFLARENMNKNARADDLEDFNTKMESFEEDTYEENTYTSMMWYLLANYRDQILDSLDELDFD